MRLLLYWGHQRRKVLLINTWYFVQSFLHIVFSIVVTTCLLRTPKRMIYVTFTKSTLEISRDTQDIFIVFWRRIRTMSDTIQKKKRNHQWSVSKKLWIMSVVKYYVPLYFLPRREDFWHESISDVSLKRIRTVISTYYYIVISWSE